MPSTKPETLYHYCGTDSFFSMVTSRSLWLSSLRLSNDTMEGHLVNSTVARLAQKDSLTVEVLQRLEESIGFLERTFDGLGFCLSEDGDLLSQWRGYADDARGLSIGFSRTYLESLAESTRADNASTRFAVLRAEYDSDKQEADVKPTYNELIKLIRAGAFKRKGRGNLLDSRNAEQIASDDRRIEDTHAALLFRLLDLFSKLYQLKGSAFREEREWRLVSIVSDHGTEPCSFRAAKGRIVPYRAYELKQLEVASITEIILGPRHETPPSVVKSMLKKTGFGDVLIRQSSATYR